jgi:uncharacterized protein (DUF1330 family)
MDDKFYENLIKLLKLFKNRPYHLAKYLIENSSFDDIFITNVKTSSKLSNLELDDDVNIINNFGDISEMEEFYNSLLAETKIDSNESNIEFELNDKLDKLIKQEKYEEASRLRDYMNKNNIKRK